jgi:hypothetical protein
MAGQRGVLRKYLITKHNYILYFLSGTKLILVDIVDTRKDKE